MYGNKIRTIRELRGYSQEYLAQRLGIAQNSYSRIENNQTKLSTEMLEKLANELGVTPADIISSELAIVNFSPTNHGPDEFNHIANFYGIQKEMIDKFMNTRDEEIKNLKVLYEQVIASKDAEIERLQQLVNQLLAK